MPIDWVIENENDARPAPAEDAAMLAQADAFFDALEAGMVDFNDYADPIELVEVAKLHRPR